MYVYYAVSWQHARADMISNGALELLSCAASHRRLRMQAMNPQTDLGCGRHPSLC